MIFIFNNLTTNWKIYNDDMKVTFHYNQFTCFRDEKACVIVDVYSLSHTFCELYEVLYIYPEVKV